MTSKSAGIFSDMVTERTLPQLDQFGDKLLTYGPTSLALGAGGAGLLHLLAKVRQDKKMQTSRDTPNEDILTVPIPAVMEPKAAGLAQLPGAIAKAPGSIAKWIMTHKGPSLAIAGITAGTGLTAAQSAGAIPTTDAPANPLWDLGMSLGAIGLAGGAGYSLVDRTLEKREQDSLEDRLNKAKSEYGTILGQSLSAPTKVAFIMDPDEQFPILQGFLDANLPAVEKLPKTGTLVTNVTSGASGLFVLSAVLSHLWMYNRQKELENLHDKSKPSAPKQIRLVSAPAAPAPAAPVTPAPVAPTAPAVEAQPALPAPQPRLGLPEPEPKIAIDLAEIVGGAAVAGGLGQEKPVSAPRKPVIPQTISKEIAPGTVEVAGPEDDDDTEIQAQDPATAAILHRNQAKITKLLALVHSREATAPAI